MENVKPKSLRANKKLNMTTMFAVSVLALLCLMPTLSLASAAPTTNGTTRPLPIFHVRP